MLTNGSLATPKFVGGNSTAGNEPGYNLNDLSAFGSFTGYIDMVYNVEIVSINPVVNLTL